MDESLCDAKGPYSQARLPVARIDMYVCGEKIYFGEMTMTSQAGFMDFYTPEFLERMGNLTKLPIDE